MEIKKEIGMFENKLTIDGIDVNEMREEKLRISSIKLFHWLAANNLLGWFLSTCAEEHGKHNFCMSTDLPFECGDSFTLNI